MTEHRDSVLTLHIQKVPGSNLGPETDYSEDFLGFTQFLRESEVIAF